MQSSYSIAEMAECLRRMHPSRELAVITRSVRYWVGENLLHPTGAIRRGRGRDRVFERSEVLRAAIVFELSKYNLTANSMRFMMKELDEEIVARRIGDLFALINALPAETCFRFAAHGQEEVYILLGSIRRPTPKKINSYVFVNGREAMSELGAL
jgi:hypothetical protein